MNKWILLKFSDPISDVPDENCSVFWAWKPMIWLQRISQQQNEMKEKIHSNEHPATLPFVGRDFFKSINFFAFTIMIVNPSRVIFN